MKKLGFFAALFVLLTAFTCENEPLDSELTGDDNGNSTTMEGTWQLTAWQVAEAVDLNNDGTANTNLLTEMDCYNNETLQFNANGSGVSMSTSYASIEFNIVAGTTNEYNYTIDCIAEDENSNFTWTQNGNVITISVEQNDSFDAQLSVNTLSISIPEGYTALNSDDATVVITQDLTLVYTKQ